MSKRPFPAAWVALSGIFALCALLPPPGRDGRIAHLPSVCPFYALTGLPCPGCGLTRAFVCLGHGQVVQSLHWHPLGIVLYAACAALWTVRGWEWAYSIENSILLTPQAAARWSRAGLIVVLGFGLARIGWVWTHGGHWPA